MILFDLKLSILVLFGRFWSYLGPFWVFWESECPVLVGGRLDAKCLKLGDLGLF